MIGKTGRILAVLAVVAAAAAACAPKVQKPEVSLAGVRVGGLGLQGGLLYVSLQVINPNSFDLVTEGLTYDLDLSDPGTEGGWIDFAEGTLEEDIRVEARDSAVVEIPVEFTYGAAAGALRSVLARGVFSYRVRGMVAVERPIRTELPFTREGIVSMARE